MAGYSVPVAQITERELPDGSRMLHGRFGDAVLVGLPLEPSPEGRPRWRLTLVTPNKRRGAYPSPQERAGELEELARRAGRHRPTSMPEG